MESWHPRTCTCSGVVMPDDCRPIVGIDHSADPAFCSDGTFTCGDLECKKYLEYCEETLPGAGGAPSYACKAATCSTGIADCECLEILPQVACEKGDDAQIRVTISPP